VGASVGVMEKLEMPGRFVSCPFEECEYFGKVEYAEIAFFERHLASKHDFIELYHLALEKGIVKDQNHFHSLNFVVKRIARIFTFRGITA